MNNTTQAEFQVLAGFEADASSIEEATRTAVKREESIETFVGKRYRHDEFVFDQSTDKFWNTYTLQLLSPDAVDNCIPRNDWTQPPAPTGRGRPPAPIKPSSEIKQVEQELTVVGSTYWPGRPQQICNVVVNAAGFEFVRGVKVFNTYRLPVCMAALTALTDETPVAPWLNLLEAMCPDKRERDYFINYCAHMIQFPGQKCNAGIVFSGSQGIGKDAILLPLKEAVGFGNAKSISPDALFGDFNEYTACVMLVVNEARVQKDNHKATDLYNITKTLCVSPPETLAFNAKFMREMWMPNVLRLIITTNEVEGLFIPPDDRRLFILHSDATRWDAPVAAALKAYWPWMRSHGGAALRRYLLSIDLSSFDHAKEPPTTTRHALVVNSWLSNISETLANSLKSYAAEHKEPDDDHDRPRVVIAASLKRAIVNGKFDNAAEAVKLASDLVGRTGMMVMRNAGYEELPRPDFKAADSGKKSETRWDERVFDENGFVSRVRSVVYRRKDVAVKDAILLAKQMITTHAISVKSSEMAASPASR